MSEKDSAEAEAFLNEVLLCLSVMGVPLFEIPSTKNKNVLHISTKNITARGYDSSQGFVVLADSEAVNYTTPSCPTFVKHLRETLT